MSTLLESFQWSEKYRPKTIAECILPEGLKQTFQHEVDTGKIQDMTFAGGAGVGKTTVAKALCDQLGYDWIIINGSNEGRQIETLRNKVQGFASSLSMTGARKCVIFDEFDHSNADSVQPALRSMMESFSTNCSFIFTCNFKNKIMEALRSRAIVIDFVIPEDEKQRLMMQFAKRACEILTAENVQFDRKTVAHLVMKHYPDWRRTINEMQRYSRSGHLTDDVLKSHSSENVDELINMIKTKEFTKIRQFIYSNPSIDMTTLVRELDDRLYTKCNPKSIPDAILIFADYQQKHVTALDPQINMLAMMIHLMQLEWQ